MSELVIGSVVAPFKAVSGEATQWLDTAHELTSDALGSGFERVHFFAALEMDGRGDEPYAGLQKTLQDLDAAHENVTASYWKFSIDDGSETIDGRNRLYRICIGRNLIQEFAMQNMAASHLMFLDSDLRVPGDSVSKLMEMDFPIVGGDVPSYCLSGPVMTEYDFPVQQHWNTAGFLLVQREVFRRVRWRHDVYDDGASDDPCFNADVAQAGFGGTKVRKDLIGNHKPLVTLDHRGHDLRVYR